MIGADEFTIDFGFETTAEDPIKPNRITIWDNQTVAIWMKDLGRQNDVVLISGRLVRPDGSRLHE